MGCIGPAVLLIAVAAAAVFAADRHPDHPQNRDLYFQTQITNLMSKIEWQRLYLHYLQEFVTSQLKVVKDKQQKMAYEFMMESVTEQVTKALASSIELLKDKEKEMYDTITRLSIFQVDGAPQEGTQADGAPQEEKDYEENKLLLLKQFAEFLKEYQGDMKPVSSKNHIFLVMKIEAKIREAEASVSHMERYISHPPGEATPERSQFLHYCRCQFEHEIRGLSRRQRFLRGNASLYDHAADLLGRHFGKLATAGAVGATGLYFGASKLGDHAQDIREKIQQIPAPAEKSTLMSSQDNYNKITRGVAIGASAALATGLAGTALAAKGYLGQHAKHAVDRAFNNTKGKLHDDADNVKKVLDESNAASLSYMTAILLITVISFF